MNPSRLNQDKMAVLQLIDNLGYGGAENMAVQIANTIAASDKFASFICASREGGVYEKNIRHDVQKIILNKKGFFDFKAFKKLFIFLKENDIRIIQAHSSSIFWALIIKIVKPKCKIIWHNHSGMSEFAFSRQYKIRNLPIKWLKNLISHYLVVNDVLLRWNLEWLRVPASKNEILLNYPVTKHLSPSFMAPFNPDKAIICLANIREQKGHPFLIAAINKVFEQRSDWNLILVGIDFGGKALHDFKTAIAESSYKERIHWLGGKSNVGDYLANSSIAVLSSKSEGLPVALLEYGLYKLPVVATNVGQIQEVLADTGMVVNYGDVETFSSALLELMDKPDLRQKLGNLFFNRVQANYSEDAARERLISIYKQIIK